jgi:hypothetical protein
VYRIVIPFIIVVAALSCAATRSPAVDSPGDPLIRVYVYYNGNPAPEPLPGATVLVLGTDGRVVAKATTDREGVATFAGSFDRPETTYFLADFPPLLVSGVRWSAGRREYNLPLVQEPLVNRATVIVP